ncbi:hypothetical protein CCHR01_06337 [Colletotrichum chrysophilum]|uniref:Uncharacterized protein n=1 Tax=Colletotrichum chrysophilum TaxID=1836956 RepID=A0AAD9EJW0_9PEZI|nr:hypothetical protein CCHR01_06337 [Colletotrichum chrysophilum]
MRERARGLSPTAQRPSHDSLTLNGTSKQFSRVYISWPRPSPQLKVCSPPHPKPLGHSFLALPFTLFLQTV